MRFNRYAPLITGAAVFLASYTLYLATLCPSVYLGDSGEIITAAFTLGIPHPTGFPLYLLTAKIAGLIPAGSFAFRVNVLSALSGAMIPALLFTAIYFYMRSANNIFLKYVLPAVASLLLTFSFTLWSQSVKARVYPLNGVFCAALLALAVYYTDIKRDIKVLYLLALTTGLGAGLHVSCAIFSVITWIYVAATSFHPVKKNLHWVLFFIALGLTSYLYVFIRQASDPVIKWQDFSSVTDYWNYFTQHQYSHKMGTRTAAGFSSFLSYTAKTALDEFTPAGFIIFVVSVIWSFINKFRYNALFLPIFISNFLLLAFYGYGSDLYISFRYYIPSYIVMAFYFYLFFTYLYALIKNHRTGVLITMTLSFFLWFSMADANFTKNNKSSNYIAYNYPSDILSYIPDKAYLFTSGDNQIYPIAFYKYVAGKKKDVTIFDSTNTIFRDIDSLLKKSGSSSMAANIITAFSEGFTPLYSTIEPGARSIPTYDNGFVLYIPEREGKPRYYIWDLYSLRGIIWDIPRYYTYEEREVAGTYLYKLSDYYKERGNTAVYMPLLEMAAETGYDSVAVLGNAAIRYATDPALEDGFTKAESYYLAALKIDPMNEYIHFNLGSLYGRRNMLEKAAQHFNMAKTINPRNANAVIYYNNVMKQMQSEKAMAALTKERDKHFESGAALFKERKYDEAIEEFKADIKENPDYDRSYFHIGLIDLYREKLEDAVPWLEKAYARNPKNVSTLNNLGLLHYRLYHKDKARKYLEESLAVNPNQERIINVLKELK